MRKTKVEPPVKPNVNQPNANRRKILQGTLAAPMVLTVSSASASVTSFGKCLARLQDAPTGPFFSTSPDNWFRKTVNVVELNNQGDKAWYFLDPYRGYVNISTMQPTGFGQILPTGWAQVGQANTRWALVWVSSANGSEAQIQTLQPVGYQATTMSCMTSVRPGAIL